MSNIMETYKKTTEKQQVEGDVMGVIRTLFPDIEVETFMKRRSKKGRKS